MWQLSQPWWEFVIRGVVIYVFVYILLRMIGKKQVGQLAPFDFVLLLILSNAVQNSMNAGDNTITAGIILGATLMVLNVTVNYLIFRSKAVEDFIEGKPVLLIHDGIVYHNVLRKEKITQHEMETALRLAGAADVASVRYGILEPNGQITVIRKDSPKLANPIDVK